MTEAIVAGHICIDIIPIFEPGAQGQSMDTLVAPGRLTEVGEAVLSTGGAVSNTGLSLHSLGIDTALMGKIGQDLFGKAILDIIRSYSDALADGMIVAPDAVSSYTLVINPPGMDRAFLHCAGANHDFGAGDVRYDLLEDDGARLFHFGYPPIMGRFYQDGGDELEAMFRRAQDSGATTSLDMSMPDPKGPSGRADWHAVLARTLPHAPIFGPSFEEMLFMLERARFDELEATGDLLGAMTVADLEGLAEKILSLGARILLLKIGDRGAYLRTTDDLGDLGRAAPPDVAAWAGREMWAPCFEPEQVAGTTGAGDATIAGLLAAILHGYGPEDALTMATAVGACSVEGKNSLDKVRSWEATEQRIQAGWPRQHLAIDAPGWRWDPERQLWFGPHDGAS